MWSILIYYLNSCCFLFAIQISHEKFLLFAGDSTRQHRLAKREGKYILVFSYDIECIYLKRNLFICGNFLWLKLRTGKLKGKRASWMGKYYNIFINTYISEPKMFDSWFDDVTPTQFPKTDINFFNLANNSTALEPWNKTTYKFRPSTKEETERTIKRRNLSYDSYEKAIQGVKRKSSLGVKHKVTLSTLTFHLSADNTLN